MECSASQGPTCSAHMNYVSRTWHPSSLEPVPGTHILRVDCAKMGPLPCPHAQLPGPKPADGLKPGRSGPTAGPLSPKKTNFQMENCFGNGQRRCFYHHHYYFANNFVKLEKASWRRQFLKQTPNHQKEDRGGRKFQAEGRAQTVGLKGNTFGVRPEHSAPAGRELRAGVREREASG